MIIFRVKWFILLLLIVTRSFSQSNPDSLYKMLVKTGIHDTTRINIYNELCWPVYSSSNTDSSVKYGLKAIELSAKINDTLKLIIAYRRLGIAYINKANHTKALECEHKSYDLASRVHAQKAMASALNNLSVIYLNISDFKKAIDYSIQAQKIQEALKDSSNLFSTYYNLGLLFRNIDDFSSAMNYYKKALTISTHQKKYNNKAAAYFGIANILKNQKNFDSAYYYYALAEKLYIQVNDLKGLMEVYTNLGGLYMADTRIDDHYKKALSTYYKALEINKTFNSDFTKSNILGNIAALYFNLSKIDSCIYFSKQALNYAYLSNERAEIVVTSKLLSDAYYLKGDFNQSILYLNKHIEMKDSVYNYEKQKEIEQKQLRYEFEKKTIADSLKVAEEKKLTNEKLKQEKTIRYSLFFFISLLILFSFFMYNRFKVIKSQKHIIETQKHEVDEKQKEIVDSIKYAKRIQSTILNNQLILKDLIPENFIYFKPKDIVSGDFYWAHKKGDFYYLAVCDCTGHGVPGAFMSLLSIGFLNEAINDTDILKPNEIFDYVRERIIQSISQEEQKDGFDGILLCINIKTRKITYAAANNKPILISNNTFIEQKVDKMPVGKGEKQEPFSLHEINSKAGDIIYLYTDGYADQFGGPKGKKFKYKPLNEILLTNSQLPMDAQLNILKEEFSNWKGNLEQVDDVCVVGIKL